MAEYGNKDAWSCWHILPKHRHLAPDHSADVNRTNRNVFSKVDRTLAAIRSSITELWNEALVLPGTQEQRSQRRPGYWHVCCHERTSALQHLTTSTSGEWPGQREWTPESADGKTWQEILRYFWAWRVHVSSAAILFVDAILPFSFIRSPTTQISYVPVGSHTGVTVAATYSLYVL